VSTGVSTPVASASTDGEWLFDSFAPITLPAGVYVLGNVFFANVPVAQTGAPFTTIPEITEDGGVQGPANGGFAAPLTSFDEPIFGPTLETAAVPEPESASLLGFGFAAMLLWRARRRPRGHYRDDIGASGELPLRLL
jgi:PEP-CTERM motif